MDGKKKSDARELADLYVAYGGFTPRDVNYELYVGLWLNLGRARLRRASEVGLGVCSVSAESDLGREWAEALADDESQIEEIEFAARAARTEARVRAKFANYR